MYRTHCRKKVQKDGKGQCACRQENSLCFDCICRTYEIISQPIQDGQRGTHEDPSLAEELSVPVDCPGIIFPP